MRSPWLMLALTVLAPEARGQAAAPAADFVRLDRDREVTLARSAAPPQVSRDATVLVLEGNRFVKAIDGTNGVTCWVSRTQPGSLEPHCFDAEGSQTILPMHVRQVELRLEGRSAAEAREMVSRGLADGTFRLPRRPALSYMMSADQVLYNDDGRRVGAWRPHLMIYSPFVTAAELGLGEPPQGSVMVFEGGTATASIVIVVPEFVKPEPGTDASSR